MTAEFHYMDAVSEAHPSTGGAISCRKVPSDNLLVTYNDAHTPDHPETINLHRARASGKHALLRMRSW